MNLREKIAEYPNFPKKGILFRVWKRINKINLEDVDDKNWFSDGKTKTGNCLEF